MTEREQFEAWISAPPIEMSFGRFGADAAKNAWPGHYVNYQVQLAWEAWQASRRCLPQTDAPSSLQDKGQGGAQETQ